MRTLVIFKRIEIWLLLVTMVGLGLIAFRSEEKGESDRSEVEVSVVLSDQSSSLTSPEETVVPEEEVLVVEAVTTIPSEQGQIVELTLLGRSPSGEDLLIDDSAVVATTAEGELVDFFFEPFRQVDRLSAEEDSMATFKLWLEDPTEVIWLDIQGNKLEAELPH